MIRATPRRGVVLLAVLVVVVLLSLAAYQFTELMTAEAKAADSALRAAQARAFALSGVHYAAAMLADKQSFDGRLNGNPYDNEAMFRNVTVHDDDRPRFQGRFSLVAPPPLEDALAGSTAMRYGVSDESGKINLNAIVAADSSGRIAHDVLIKLPNMTEELVDAIIDWIDANDEQRPSGAENQFYTALAPPYRCKNGPLDTLEELLLVRGVTPQLLFGTDTNRNGRPDPGDAEGTFDPGWSAYLTVYSREINRDTEAQPRIYLNDKDINGLYDKLVVVVGEEVATFVVAYRLNGGSTTRPTASTPLVKSQLDFTKRGQNISGIYYLVDNNVTIAQSGGGSGGGSSKGGGGGSQSITYPNPMADATKRAQYLPLLLEKCTTRKDAEIPARINVNTASRAVLMTLPGLEEADVQAILDSRPQPGSESDAAFQTTSWLMTGAKLSAAKMRALERYVTATSQTYRVQALGYYDQGGPVARVEAIVDTNGGQPRIVYYRDLSELGRGFEVPR